MSHKSDNVEMATCIIKGLASTILEAEKIDREFLRPIVNENAKEVIKCLGKLNAYQVYHLSRLLKRARELRFKPKMALKIASRKVRLRVRRKK